MTGAIMELDHHSTMRAFFSPIQKEVLNPIGFLYLSPFCRRPSQGARKRGERRCAKDVPKAHPLESESNNEWSRTCLKRKL